MRQRVNAAPLFRAIFDERPHPSRVTELGELGWRRAHTSHVNAVPFVPDRLFVGQHEHAVRQVSRRCSWLGQMAADICRYLPAAHRKNDAVQRVPAARRCFWQRSPRFPRVGGLLDALAPPGA